MKKIIIFILIGILMVSIAGSEPQLSNNEKLKNYADTNFKEVIGYKTITIGDIEQDGDIKRIHLTIDGRDVRWFTTERSYSSLVGTTTIKK